MHRGYKLARDMATTCPVLLPTLPPNLQAVAASLLPYSVGIEWEAHLAHRWTPAAVAEYLQTATGGALLAVEIDYQEQRIRLPAGLPGLLALWAVTEALPVCMRLNPGSGIHYHVDATDVPTLWRRDQLHIVIAANNAWVLTALESWNYTGNYNHWECSTAKTAVRFHQPLQTLEFRVGAMTFAYTELLQRCKHACAITRKIKTSLKSAERKPVQPKVTC
jgi:hypothetical protein